MSTTKPPFPTYQAWAFTGVAVRIAEDHYIYLVKSGWKDHFGHCYFAVDDTPHGHGIFLDNLENIAKRYNMSIQELESLAKVTTNHL